MLTTTATPLAPAGQLDQGIIRGPAGEPWSHCWQNRADGAIRHCQECGLPYMRSVTSPCSACGTPPPIGGTS